MDSNIEEGNCIFTFRESTSQPESMYFVEAIRKEIVDNENAEHWHLFIIEELIGKNTTISIWYFNRNNSPVMRLRKCKAILCTNGRTNQWGVNYWGTYSPVVNWMSYRDIFILSIIRDLYTKSVDFSYPIIKLM